MILLKRQNPDESGLCYALNLWNLIQAFVTTLFALNFFCMTLYCSCGFTLTLSSRLFIKFATAYISKNTGFFAGALEATQSNVKWFVVFNTDGRH